MVSKRLAARPVGYVHFVVKCRDLHNNECQQELQPDWGYCPQCGSRRLAFAWTTDTVVADGTGEGRATLQVEVPAPHSTITLRSTGVHLSQSQLDASKPGSRNISFTLDQGLHSGEIRARVEQVWRRASDQVFESHGRQVAREEREHVVHINSSTNRARLVVLPERVKVRPGRKVNITVAVKDSYMADVSAAVKGNGWHFKGPENTRIRSNHPQEYTVYASDNAERAELVLSSSGLVEEVVVKLIPDPVLGVVEEPRFVVGIDFGTTGTSVFFRDLLGNDQPRELGVPRSNTLIWIPDEADRATWSYGEEAEWKYNERGTGRLLVELKKYLLAENEFIVATGLKATEVVAWYLRRLVSDRIKGVLEHIANSTIESLNIDWRLSIPALDDSMRTQYIERLRQAALIAGIPGRGSLSFIPEPEAALRAILTQENNDISGLEDGDRVMVVDGGGGTTDVCFGTFRREGGSLRLEAPTHRHVELKERHQAGVVASAYSFGGGDVTRLIGATVIYYWLIATGTGPDAQAVLSELTGCPAADWSGFPELMPYRSDINAERYWHLHDISSIQRIERVKLELAQNGQGFFRASRLGNLDVTQRDIDAARNALSKQFNAQLFSLVEEQANHGHATKWIFFVGGNSLIPTFRERPDNVAHMIEVPDPLRRLAVVQGLASGELKPPLASERMRILLGSEGEAEIVLSVLSPSLITTHLSEPKLLRREDSVPAQVRLETLGDDNKWYNIAQAAFKWPAGRTSFTTVWVHGSVDVYMNQSDSPRESIFSGAI